ncbi:ecdysone 20-monooxygenase isoform X2 [Folsomia candida]|uniref:ecdysone 20-monooxygenase isoform X2 n=1 Tax=Folsomia candida TaxID=158441 RepID=UPI001604C272|nr:ecdysone 20-monooxygenase isoform X2 [Folsomia candida]
MEQSAETIQNAVLVWTLTVLKFIQHGIMQILNFFTFMFGNADGTNKESDKSDKPKLKSVKQIPGPAPLPIFGTTLTSPALKMTNLLKANEGRWKEFGPIVKEEHLWGFPMIHLLDADHIEYASKMIGNFRPGMEILTTYRSNHPDRYDSIGLTNAQGEEWEMLHGALSPLITNLNFIKSIAPAAAEMTADFKDLIKESGPYIEDVQSLVRKFAAESSFYNVFGRRMGFMFNEVPTNMQEFLHTHDRLWRAVHQSSYGFPWWKYFPTSLWNQNAKSESLLLDMMENMIQTSIKEDSTHEGLLGGLLDVKDVSYKTKRLLALETILGSGDSVISALTFALYWISRDKRVSNKLYEELKTILPTKDSELNYDELQKLPYLKACITESYRMSNPAPNIMRLVEQPLELGGYLIPAYSLLILQWGFAVMQEDSFYKPKEFLPERWIYEGNEPRFQPHRRSLMHPFGYGKRSCPGKRIVTLYVHVLLARVSC